MMSQLALIASPRRLKARPLRSCDHSLSSLGTRSGVFDSVTSSRPIASLPSGPRDHALPGLRAHLAGVFEFFRQVGGNL